MQIAAVEKSKRRFPRRAYRRHVGILFAGDYFLSRGVEIGEGGLSFSSNMGDIPENAMILISFRTPTGQFISVRSCVKSKITKSGDSVYGCEFEKLNFNIRREIRTFVSARSETEL